MLHDLRKGRGFPTCVGYNGNIVARVRNEVHITKDNNNDFVCPDGETRPFLTLPLGRDQSGYRHFCRKINISVPRDTASDAEHLNQTYYINE